ncbi:MAG: LamG domain-containing protein, partial [Phycisphaerae bacterium]|nr:LamG domain-containing protein [Phycisphaerae bacterium]
MRRHVGNITAVLVVLAGRGLAAAADLPAGLPREGLVAFWSGEGHSRDAAGTNHGQLRNGATFVKGKVGKAFKFDGTNDYLYVGNPSALQITGSQTIAMWISPTRLGRRQCPFAKTYGGEGTIVLEPDGKLYYMYGPIGRNSKPYASVVVNPGVVKAGRWTHIAAVRDLKARKLRWYVDGRLVAEAPAPYPAARASQQPVFIGLGYAGWYVGLIDEIGVWKRALRGDEIAAMIHAFGFPHLTRLALSDRVEAAGGIMVKGTISNKSYTVATAFGSRQVPAEKVVGLVPVPVPVTAPQPALTRVRVVMVDGQIVTGTLAGQTVDVVLPGGSVLRIPMDRIQRCAYRITSAKPSAPSAAAATMIALRSGDRLALADQKFALRFQTECGVVSLPASSILEAKATGSSVGKYRMMLVGGSVLTGAPADESMTLALALGGLITVRREDIFQLT